MYKKIVGLLLLSLIISSLTACAIAVDRYKIQRTSHAYNANESVDKILKNMKHGENETVRYSKNLESCGDVLLLGTLLPVPLLRPCYSYSEATFENAKLIMLTQVEVKESHHLCALVEVFMLTGFKHLCTEVLP